MTCRLLVLFLLKLKSALYFEILLLYIYIYFLFYFWLFLWLPSHLHIVLCLSYILRKGVLWSYVWFVNWLVTEVTAACTEGIHGELHRSSTWLSSHGRVHWWPMKQTQPSASVQRRCCELQVSGQHRQIWGFLYKLSFVCCLHAIICDILFFKYV